MGSFRKYGPQGPAPAIRKRGDDAGETAAAGSAYERLTQAWHPGSAPRIDDPPPVESGFRFAQSRPKTILLCVPPGYETLSERLEASWPEESRTEFRLVATAPARAEELDQLLSAHSPHLLLVDSALCSGLGVQGIRRLRHAFPQVDWIIGGTGVLPHWVDLPVHSQARGCIAWNAEPADLVRAIRTVLVGELWFPRRMMQEIYLCLLSEMRAENGGDERAPPPPADGAALSTREAEVLALTRKGLTNKQIAARLDISVNTVKKHLTNAFEKRGLRSRRQIVG